jgi:uncharacterized protein (TIGR02270 family)
MNGASQVLAQFVQEHAEEMATLFTSRCVLIRAPHVNLADLHRWDERIAAHLDGLAVGGPEGAGACDALLAEPEAGELFAVTTYALEAVVPSMLEKVFAHAAESPGARRGLFAAFGWVNGEKLRNVVASLLRSEDPLRRVCGVAASAMHRVDPGVVARLQEDADPMVRARLLRTAGELGRREWVSLCERAMGDEDASAQFWAAWSAMLLGSRESAPGLLTAFALKPGPHQARALQLLLLAADVEQGHAILQPYAGSPENLRLVIKGAGCVGDPKYVPWLIGHMGDDKLARLAGESFSMITGIDLTRPPFDRLRPEKFESGPSEDPAEEDVGLDEDDDLTWPVQSEVQNWWQLNGARFATGVRHFMGTPLNRTRCIEVLRNGFQRQRIAAAHHLCLLAPGTPLFEWRAPARRQKSALELMT